MKIIAKLKKEIIKNKNFLITTHINSEGDAIGSELAFYYLLKRLKKNVRIVNADALPRNLKFLPGVEKIEIYRKKLISPRDFDTLVVLDVPAPARLGIMKDFLKEAKYVINIDHHISNIKFGDLNLVKRNASSVGEMIYSIYKYFRLPLDYKVSLLIYVAILTDTGSFRYVNTTPTTHKIVSVLLSKGVLPYKVYTQIYENNSIEKIRCLGKSLQTINKKNGIAWVEIKKNILTQSGAREEDLEGIIDYVRSIRGIKIAIVFYEGNSGNIKVSFRSQDERIDVNSIAEYFGGGGHKMASGCRIKGSLEAVKREVFEKIHEYTKLRR